VVLAARSAEKLRQVATEIAEFGVKAHAVPIDLCDPMAWKKLTMETITELSSIDILVNNASAHHGGRLHKRTPEQIEAVLQTNLVAAIQLTRQVLPTMLNQGSGHIVHIASIAGKAGIPYLSVYDATKYGLIGFNHSLQAELHGTGVYSSAVCPGFIRGDGMWARLNRKIHPAFGLSSPEHLSKAVVRVITHEKVEHLVNPLPVRPAILLWALWPGLATRTFRWLRVNQFMEGAALQVEAEDNIQETERVE